MESCSYGKENQQKKYKNNAFSVRFRLFNAFLCKKMLTFADEIKVSGDRPARQSTYLQTL